MLILDPYGNRPSAIASNKGFPKNYCELLNFTETWFSIHARHAAQVARTCIRNVYHRKVDPIYIDLLVELLRALKDLNYQDNEFYLNIIRGALGSLAVICHGISWDLKKCFFDLIPWQNIEGLFVFMQQNQLQDVYLKEYLQKFMAEAVPILLKNFVKMREKRNDWYAADTSDFPAEVRIKGIEHLYDLTDPFQDLNSLNELVDFAEKAQHLDSGSIEGRQSILSLVKLIGEFSKFAQLSRHLSFACQKMFHNVPWHIFIELRNLICKSIETPSQTHAYLTVTAEGNKELFVKIQTTLNIFHTNAVEVQEQFLNSMDSPHQLAELYSKNFSGITVNSDELTLLKQDLNLVRDQIAEKFYYKISKITGAKNKQKKIRSDLQKKKEKFSKSCNEAYQEVEKSGISKTSKGKVSQVFHDADEINGAEDFFSKWKASITAKCPDEYKSLISLQNRLKPVEERGIYIDYKVLSAKLIADLAICFLSKNSLQTMDDVKCSLADASIEIHKEVHDNFNLYLQNTSRFLHIQLMMCDLHECLVKVDIPTKTYKMLRNFLEHRDATIMHSRPSFLNLKIFLMEFGCLLDARRALMPLLQQH